MTGYPTASAASSASSGVARGRSEPGEMGRPASLKTAFERSLSPDTVMAPSGGPTKTMSASSQARTNRGFSDRKPYPGWMASASAFRAVDTMASTSR